MLERKFKKLVESYPNLVDGRFAISKAKAEEIIAEKGGHASLEEIVDRAKKGLICRIPNGSPSTGSSRRSEPPRIGAAQALAGH